MKKIIIAGFVAVSLAAVSARAQTIVQWNFENAADTNGMVLAPGAGNSPGNAAADIDVPGGSLATGKHATTSTYSTPAGDVDLTLAPTINPSTRSLSANGWSVGDYWQFSTSTLGYTGVQVAWDQTGSNTGPADFQLSYSLDGGATFVTPGSTYALTFASWNATSALGNNESQTFAGAIDNQTSVIFRITDMATTAINGTLGSAGTDRVDNFTVFAVPEPSSVALVGAGLLGLLAMRRRRS